MKTILFSIFAVLLISLPSGAIDDPNSGKDSSSQTATAAAALAPGMMCEACPNRAVSGTLEPPQNYGRYDQLLPGSESSQSPNTPASETKSTH